MRNEDATWCTNEKCSCKTNCWRWLGFYESEDIDPHLVRKHKGGDNCKFKIERSDSDGKAATIHA